MAKKSMIAKKREAEARKAGREVRRQARAKLKAIIRNVNSFDDEERAVAQAKLQSHAA